jgi:hypothetical protein
VDDLIRRSAEHSHEPNADNRRIDFIFLLMPCLTTLFGERLLLTRGNAASSGCGSGFALAIYRTNRKIQFGNIEKPKMKTFLIADGNFMSQPRF